MFEIGAATYLTLTMIFYRPYRYSVQTAKFQDGVGDLRPWLMAFSKIFSSAVEICFLDDH
jgi:hypothetical protein